MLVISSREFRDKQKSYFDMADNGENVIISRGKNKSYKLVPVTKDDTCMSKEDFYAKIDHAMQQIKEGKTFEMKAAESLDDFLNRIEKCID